MSNTKFPLLIYNKETESVELASSTDSLPVGETFVVLRTNASPDDKSLAERTENVIKR